MKSLSHVRLLATPWTAASQAPPSIGFSRQEYWSGLPRQTEDLLIFHFFKIISLGASWVVLVIGTLNSHCSRLAFYSLRTKIPHAMLLLLSRFSCVQLCATPQMAAHQAPLSLGFSRQEYWSGLSLPSPMHACMLSRFSHVRLCVTPWTAALKDPLSTGFSRQEYWSGLPFPSPQHAMRRGQKPEKKISAEINPQAKETHGGGQILFLCSMSHLISPNTESLSSSSTYKKQ